MGLVDAALAPVRQEPVSCNPNGDTRLAAVTIGTIGEEPTAAESLTNQLIVNIALHQVAGGCDLGARQQVGQIAASVCGRRIELNGLKGQLVWVRHGLVLCADKRGSSVNQVDALNPQFIAGACAADRTVSKNLACGTGAAPRDPRWVVSC